MKPATQNSTKSFMCVGKSTFGVANSGKIVPYESPVVVCVVQWPTPTRACFQFPFQPPNNHRMVFPQRAHEAAWHHLSAWQVQGVTNANIDLDQIENPKIWYKEYIFWAYWRHAHDCRCFLNQSQKLAAETLDQSGLECWMVSRSWTELQKQLHQASVIFWLLQTA